MHVRRAARPLLHSRRPLLPRPRMAAAPAASSSSAAAASSPLYAFSARAIDNKTDVSLGAYAGKVLLIVNTASQCGFTKQYEGLEALYRRLGERGLVVLGFPCDQFGHQEPGPEADIAEFCRKNFGVTFPLFAKVEVNGDKAHPLFAYLKHQKSGLFGTEFIKWNFTKFLVDRSGRVVHRYSPNDAPEALEKDIVALLDQKV